MKNLRIYSRGGDDRSAVKDQLRNVQTNQTATGAFAAILADGPAVLQTCSEMIFSQFSACSVWFVGFVFGF